MIEQHPFKWRHFQSYLILLCVSEVVPALSFELSRTGRNHAGTGTARGSYEIYRWVQQYAPEFERRGRPHLKSTADSWRVDETYIKVKKEWVYLYRAVDSQGNTLDFLLSPTRNAQAPFLTRACLRTAVLKQARRKPL